MSLVISFQRTAEKKNEIQGTSLVFQWLRLHASKQGDMGLIPGQRSKIPHAARRSQISKLIKFKIIIVSVTHSVMSDILWSHGL